MFFRLPNCLAILRKSLPKSKLIQVREVTDIEGWAAALGSRVGIPTFYLGLPLGASLNLRLFGMWWDCFNKRLTSWKKTIFVERVSLWGKKSSGNKLHLVKWDIVFEAKNLGGLDLRGLEILNDSFLANGCEGFLRRTDNCIWKSIEGGTFGVSGDGWCSKGIGKPCGVELWKGYIGRGLREFWLRTTIFVGSGLKPCSN